MRQENRAALVSGSLEFAEPGMALCGPVRGLSRGDGFTIEAWIEPFGEPDDSLGGIVTFISGRSALFALSQWKSFLVLRVNKAPGAGLAEYDLDGGLRKGRAAFIALSTGQSGTVYYRDGKPLWTSSSLDLARNGADPVLLLGTSPDASDQWMGRIRGVAVFDRTLDKEIIEAHYKSPARAGEAVLFYGSGNRGLTAADDLAAVRYQVVVPRRFDPVERTFLISPLTDFRLNQGYILDVLLNLAGFMPLGFCLAALVCSAKGRARPGALCVMLIIAAGAGLSLAIEVSQAYLPGRTSSMMDLIDNTAGTAIGVLAYTAARRMSPQGRFLRRLLLLMT